jgi:hypothetical protein
MWGRAISKIGETTLLRKPFEGGTSGPSGLHVRRETGIIASFFIKDDGKT